MEDLTQATIIVTQRLRVPATERLGTETRRAGHIGEGRAPQQSSRYNCSGTHRAGGEEPSEACKWACARAARLEELCERVHWAGADTSATPAAARDKRRVNELPAATVAACSVKKMTTLVAGASRSACES